MKKLLLVLSLLATPAIASAAVGLTSIAVASGTVTVVTASAHGLAVNTGFCLSAPASVCAAAKTITNSTTFTFDMPSNVTVSACASSCGTGDLAPKAIVLGVQASQTTQTVTYALWVTTLTPLPRSGATSAWTNAIGTGATTAQNNALASGAFVELVTSFPFPASTTTATMQTIVQNAWTSAQAALAATTQPGAFYGFVWNGSTWVQQ
jgi:hypothetical protein